MMRKLILSVVTLAVTLTVAMAHGQARQDVAPRLFIDAAGIQRANDRAAKTDWAGEIREKILSDSRAIIAEPLEVPDKGGQWGHHYVCKKCGTRLETVEKRHICPNCKAEYTGWPYDEVVAARKHIRNWSNVETLGVGYAMSGNRRFAEYARRILVAYADRYVQYPYHDYRGGTLIRGARVLAQTLDESVQGIGLTWGYDLTRGSDAYSDADRAHIENDLFRQMVTTVKRNDMKISNWQTWHNALFTVIGVVLNDEELIRHAVDGKSGVRFQLKNSVLSDGFWYEAAPGYHFYSLEALRYTAEALLARGINLYEEKPLQAMFDAPLDYAFPNGDFPTVNDSERLNISKQKPQYEIGYARYKDARMGAVAARGKRTTVEAYFFGEDQLPAESVSSTSSRNFEGIGAAMLRRNTPGGQICIHVDYGPHGGAHGHPDKLGIIIYKGDREISPDPGRLAYAAPLHPKWYRTTLAHNTLVVDQKDQKQAQGKLEILEDTATATICRVTCHDAYKGVKMTRTVTITDEKITDVMVAESEESHVYDLAYHFNGQLESRAPSAALPGQLPAGAGYDQILEPKEFTVSGNVWEASFTSSGKTGVYQVALVNDSPTRVFSGVGYARNPPEKCPMIIVRRQGKRAEFVSTIYPDRP